ncbi:FecR family protein [Mangrovibacterium lignilyticum]|uniref:FecR family protein n=1 Tax=Mangrovibacterium lignilyticum TaxID=2668052 RepID=UPI0013D7211D|nr:FecR domain-containing protein [Mangrovibacterium lignilyticum]
MEYAQIIKYIAGEASEEEVRAIFQWIESSSDNKEEFVKLKKAYALTSKSADNAQHVWNDVMIRRIHRKENLRRLYTYTRYAAIIVLFFALGMVFQNQLRFGKSAETVYASNMSIDVPLGQMSDLTLPDGTTVQLNSGSHFAYTGNFAAGDRTVELQGEAFFEVAKDANHPFTVKTKSLDFKVYGTSFNIQAYEDEKEVNTTLVEGSLGVLSKTGKEFTRLVPGENVKYNDDSKELVVKNVNTDLYTSWQKGLITFRNEKLQDIAKKMERWYNVEIKIEDQELADELYFGTIMKNKPIDQILEVFRMTSSLQYRILPRPGEPTLIYWE